MPNPYLCPAGVPTIGYGTTIYPNGKKITLRDRTITEAEACEFLMHDLETFAAGVRSLVKVTITQGLFDALVSFAYNVGLDIDSDNVAEGLGDSTLLKLVNANIVETDKNWKLRLNQEFMKWCKARKKGVMITLPGLLARRMSEAYLACEGVFKYFAAPKK